MKPDWKDAPEWAEYLAVSTNGWADWFERNPVKDGGTYLRGIGRMKTIGHGHSEYSGLLERRPK